MPNFINLYYTFDYPRPSDSTSSSILIGAAPDGSDIIGGNQSFQPLRLNDFDLQTNEDSGRLHGGVLYSNVLDARFSHTIYLQPRELTATKMAFLKTFWRADFKYIQFPDGGTGFNKVREVRTSGGKFPLNRINDNKYLKELTIELTEVQPYAG